MTSIETDETPEDGSASGGRRRSLAWLSTVVGLAVGGLTTFYVVRTLIDEWPAASAALETASLSWIAVAAVLALLAMTAMGWGWGFVLRLFGVRVPSARVVAWYFVGELGKYLPGGVWTVLGRGELARRGGVPRTRAYASVAMSLAMLYLAAMFVASAFLPFTLSGDGANVWMLFLLALPVGVLALHHAVLERVLALVVRISGRELTLEIPRWRDSLIMVACYLPAWIFVGGGTWAVARALDPSASFSRIMFAALLSWVAGFIAVPVPAGAGVREAVLVASSGLDPGTAAATAIVARMLFLLADLVGAAVGAPLAGRKRSGATVAPITGVSSDAPPEETRPEP